MAEERMTSGSLVGEKNVSLSVNPPYGNTVGSRDYDEDGVNNGVHMMREIPSDASFQTSGGGAGSENAEGAETMGWQNKRQFFLSVVGYSVGLGNIWRFPYLCQSNGGGAFLIPFLIMIVLEGAPLLLIELGIGQRLRQGSMRAWSMIHPSIGGIGIASTIVAFLVGLYYNVIITWCFYYLFNSFQKTLPWETCPKELLANGTYLNTTEPECEKSSETAYYWYRQALDISEDIESPNGIKWWMCLCLLLAWIVVYLIIQRGIQSSGKVVYFTALFPYMVLTIFFIRGITLEGAGAGLLHMYTPKYHKLLEPSVWLEAATQVFYSFGLAFGSLIAFGSYNKTRNNCVKDVCFITMTNALTAIYASAVIFSVLGFKATKIHERCKERNRLAMHEWNSTLFPNASGITSEEYDKFFQDHPIEKNQSDFRSCNLEDELDNAAQGTGLAFVVFTQAIVELPYSPFWSIIFFLMLLALGIGSQIGTMEGVVSTVFGASYFSHIRKEVLTAIICALSFLGGLIFVTGAGEYWLTLFDGYASTTGLVIIALMETVSVMYIYGHKRFSADIEYMTGYYPGLYWQLTWRFIGPTMLVVLLIGSVIDKLQNSPEYQAWSRKEGDTHKLPFPGWVMGIALVLIMLSVLPIIVVAIMNTFNILGPSGRPRSASTTMRRIDTSASTRPMMEDYESANKCRIM
ncbi:unnamed protein product [Allacma fusca]|uniref:Transporter n=1 Tax=Allacma fusca TaxID=39272 RepID=A0A8J2NNZ6_9HEXA|nr:unnamed protein product [Allacma fusca]